MNLKLRWSSTCISQYLQSSVITQDQAQEHFLYSFQLLPALTALITLICILFILLSEVMKHHPVIKGTHSLVNTTNFSLLLHRHPLKIWEWNKNSNLEDRVTFLIKIKRIRSLSMCSLQCTTCNVSGHLWCILNCYLLQIQQRGLTSV